MKKHLIVPKENTRFDTIKYIYIVNGNTIYGYAKGP